MSRLLLAARTKAHKAFMLLRGGHLRLAASKVRRLAYSEGPSIGFRRDLDAPFDLPATTLSLTLRPMRPSESDVFVAAALTDEDVEVAMLLRGGLETPYVAETSRGEPACMFFLVDHRQNETLDALFRGAVPPLKPHELLVESTLSLPKFRGRGLTWRLMPELRTLALERGGRTLVMYVGEGNTQMLQLAAMCGFVPFTRRRELFRLFRRQVTFTPAAEAAPPLAGQPSGSTLPPGTAPGTRP